jgi:hypothetical protein
MSQVARLRQLVVCTGLSMASIVHAQDAKPPSSTPADTCTGAYPSYWQDIAPKFSDMWAGQLISNAPTQSWTDLVFKLSDAYPQQPVDDSKAQPWRAKKFDALFAEGTPEPQKLKLATEYATLVLDYIEAGNTNQPGQLDFGVCKNPVRPWFHMPYQTYDAMSGREFTHGLTREAPVTFSTIGGTGTDSSTMWAIAVFNATAGYTLGQIWQSNGQAKIPANDILFQEGAVIGKPLFNTSTVEQLPFLANMPAWNANISNPNFCACKPASGSECTLVEESQQCPRSYAQWEDVRLTQFDIAIKDNRAKGTNWVFGTFVADGVRKKSVKDPWKRLSLLGLMWGNDTPPKGQLAFDYPPNPRKNGFKEEVIVWDTVDMLNAAGGSAAMRQPGHLGCNQRLNGPADNANSSCMSCHGTASVPDSVFNTPAIISQFASPPQTYECVAPVLGSAQAGVDRSGVATAVVNKVPYTDIDAMYFSNVPAGKPFIIPIYPPQYKSGRKTWISLDYSLQMSIALKQYMQWTAAKAQTAPARVVSKELRRN